MKKISSEVKDFYSIDAIVKYIIYHVWVCPKAPFVLLSDD